MFALNNESIKYWSKFIESYCNINNIFKKRELLKKINIYIKIPIRKRAKHSISSKTEVFGENPLIYNNKIKKLGFNLIEIKYPYTEIIPPFLHDKIPIKKL